MNLSCNIPSISILATLVLLCICYTRHIDAGKGKVPIYMPIPIPIPMPMGPSVGGGGKFHHQQERHNDDEGEVKKIYLLQPMRKAQPQPQLKGGGFMGPVQTHIHMPSPIVHHNLNKQHRQQPVIHTSKSSHSSSYDGGDNGGGGGDDHHHHHDTHSSSTGKGHQPELKILPIVVIPPIAPMPPIQIPPSSNAQAPRMTLTPQFNNYVVSSGSEPRDRRNTYSSHSTMSLQDQKSFSDYGGSGGGAMLREHFGPRQRRRRPMSDYHSATRIRPSRAHTGGGGGDDFGDDYDTRDSISYSSSRRASQQGGGRANGRWAPPMRRRSYLDESGGQRNRMRSSANSIRDVIDQQSLFDDEPPLSSSSLIEHNEMRDLAQANYENRLRSHQHHNNHLSMANSSPDQPNRDTTGTSSGNMPSAGGEDREYLDQRNPQTLDNGYSSSPNDVQRYRQSEWSMDSGRGELGDRDSRNRHQADLNSVYYDRDLQVDREPHRSSTHYNSGNSVSSGKRYIDDRESFLDDGDEWRFDSIKSVTHASPNANNTVTNVTYTNVNTTKSIPTTIPPNVV